MFFAKKQPSFDESPLQDLSADQLTQVAGGTDHSCKKMEMSWSEWENWKKHHHKNSKHPVTIEIIIKQNGKTKTITEKW